MSVNALGCIRLVTVKNWTFDFSNKDLCRVMDNISGAVNRAFIEVRLDTGMPNNEVADMIVDFLTTRGRKPADVIFDNKKFSTLSMIELRKLLTSKGLGEHELSRLHPLYEDE